MIANDVVVMLHVRVRIVVSTEIKLAALKAQRDERDARARRMERLDQRRQFRRASDTRIGESNRNDQSTSPRIPALSLGNRGIEMLDGSVGWADPVIPTSPRDSIQTPGKSSTPPSSKAARVLTPHSKPRELSYRSRQGSFARYPSVSAFGQIDENGQGDRDDEPDLNDETDSEQDDDYYFQKHLPRLHTDSTEVEISELEEEEDGDLEPSFLVDPERATRAQRRWLDAMCIGKDEYLVRWFRK